MNPTRNEALCTAGCVRIGAIWNLLRARQRNMSVNKLTLASLLLKAEPGELGRKLPKSNQPTELLTWKARRLP